VLSPYREVIPNSCLSNVNNNDGTQIQVASDKFLSLDCIESLGDDIIAVYLVGLGGSWST
jgi:hypothetical protein